MILVLLLVGYNQYRIEQMRSEVSAIAGKLHGGEKGAAPGQSDLVTALAETERYTRQAKQLIKKKRLTEAQAELDKALTSLKSANHVSRDIVGSAAGFLGSAKDNAVRIFQKAWNDISEDSKPGK